MGGNALIELGVALAIGLLIGLQRERTESSLAGIRTFPLITVFGTMCGWLAQRQDAWVIPAGLIAVTALLIFGNFARLKGGEIDPGITTEVAALLAYGVGVYLVVGHMSVAIALGGAIVLLLQFKQPMHDFVAAMGETDIRAIMQFALVALVILPLLPNETLGPYDVLNPFKIWLMVVIIVGLSLGGYVLYKLYGQRTGALLHGLLGGLISSTATTVSSARLASHQDAGLPAAALVIVIASSTMFLRMVVVIGIVAAGSLQALAGPLLVMMVISAAIAVGVYLLNPPRGRHLPPQHNPAQLRSALVFGALYAAVILTVAAAKPHFGTAGLYAVAGLAGLEGVDAITLSSAQMVSSQQLEATVAWRAMLIGALANLLVKAGIAGFLGSRQLLLRLAAPFALTLAAGVALLWLWPG